MSPKFWPSGIGGTYHFAEYRLLFCCLCAKTLTPYPGNTLKSGCKYRMRHICFKTEFAQSIDKTAIMTIIRMYRILTILGFLRTIPETLLGIRVS